MFEIFYCELQKGLDDLESENIVLSLLRRENKHVT